MRLSPVILVMSLLHSENKLLRDHAAIDIRRLTRRFSPQAANAEHQRQQGGRRRKPERYPHSLGFLGHGAGRRHDRQNHAHKGGAQALAEGAHNS